MGVGDKHQVDVVIVEHVLRRVKPVVSADEIVHREQLNVAELMHHANVEHLGTEVVVLRTTCFSHLLGRSTRLPVDRLERPEDDS